MPRILAVLLAAAAAACGSSQPGAQPPAPASAPASSAAPAQPSGARPVESLASGTSEGGGQSVTGVVAESMNSGGYTYARLAGANGDTWIAATEMPLEKGANVAASVSVVMDNFHSRTLNRDFPKVAFVSDVRVNGVAVASNAEAAAVASEVGARNGMPPLVGSHGSGATAPPASAPAPPASLVEKVAPAPGGLTVFQVWQKRADMSGKAVRVRGRIVKANYEIMGTNWYHVQDGTGDLDAGTHDLTVTSRDRMNVGDVVTIAGPITLGKDFGAGYAYDVMVEGASIVK